MNGKWDFDWEVMIFVYRMVDKKDVVLEVFRNVVLLYYKDYGWFCYDIWVSIVVNEDEKRWQVFVFRDVLMVMGKDQFFYCWIEIVQYEVIQFGGFGKDKQEVVVKKIWDMFEEEGVDFDELWKEIVGIDGIIGFSG